MEQPQLNDVQEQTQATPDRMPAMLSLVIFLIYVFLIFSHWDETLQLVMAAFLAAVFVFSLFLIMWQYDIKGYRIR